MAKLSDYDVEEIRRLSASGVINRRLAEQFEVSETHIGRIVKGISWKK